MREREKRRHSGSVRFSDKHPKTTAGMPHKHRPHSIAAAPRPEHRRIIVRLLKLLYLFYDHFLIEIATCE